jgi:L-fucono-1,5-lactonase
VSIVDAHHHLWDPARRDYPWMTGERCALRRRYGLGDLRAAASAAGVEATVLVQAATAEEETRELLALADGSDGLVRAVVGWVDLTAPDVADRLAALREAPGGHLLAGIRHPVEDEPGPDWLLRDDVVQGLRAVAGTGLRYDLLVRAAQLPVAVRVAELVDDLALVLDHGAKPPIATRELEPWSSELARLAAAERVHCKLSGLVTEAGWASWGSAGVERYAWRILELFGPARVMFGSDWPVCTLAASYAEVLELAEDVLHGLGPDERASVLAGTAQRFYGLAVMAAER